MPELAKAYVQIIPSAEGVKGNLTKIMNDEAPDGKASGEKTGAGFVGAIKGVIAAAAIGESIKATLDAGGAMQQSFGGLDTLYESASGAAKDYAQQAAAAGISANTYAEQAVSFGAALKQSFGGDVAQAAEAANTALLDMADNSAKMGTEIGSIQNAYQGFAKGNYTMLDNLKLGYGGTKTEMERLLADAQKLTGVKYDISSFGDITAAIHAVQENLGVAGVAAQEASTTFTGSLGAMKAAGENFLANLSLGQDIGPSLQQLAKSTSDFLFLNLFPMIGNILSQLPAVIATAFTTIGPALAAGATGLLNNISIAVTGYPIGDDLATVMDNVWDFIAQTIPEFVQNGVDIISGWANGMMEAAPDVISDVGFILDWVLDSIMAAIPSILDSGIQLIQNMADGMQQNGPAVFQAITEAITNLISTIASRLPEILAKGIEVIQNLASGILQNIPTIVSGIASVFVSLVAAIVSHLPEILQQGIELLGKLAAGIIQAIPTLVGMLPQVFTSIINAFTSVNWGEIGINIIKGIAKGLAGAGGYLVDAAKDAAKSAFDAAKSALGIHSPSRLFRDQVGVMIARGMAEGITKGENFVTGAVEDVSGAALNSAMTSAAYSAGSNAAAVASGAAGTTIGNTFNIYGATDPQAVAERVSQILDSQIKRKAAVYA